MIRVQSPTLWASNETFRFLRQNDLARDRTKERRRRRRVHLLII